MYISLDWGLIKLMNLLFGLFIIFVGIYPFIQGNFSALPTIEDRLLHFIIIFVGIIQIIFGLKSHRPKID